jgi:hypothetical protein
MSDLNPLMGAFGVGVDIPAPKMPPPLPPPPPPAEKEKPSIAPEDAAMVQALVWKNGNAPPPKAPTSKNVDQGQVGAMGESKGWGAI